MGKRGPKKGEGGRKKLDVNWSAIDKLCALHAPANEIADYLSVTEGGVSYDTLDRRCKEEHDQTFAEYVKQKTNAHGKVRLRQLQWKAAQAGNTTMLVWLGKQMLGQRDKVAQDNTSSDGSMTPKVTEIVIRDATDDDAKG